MCVCVKDLTGLLWFVWFLKDLISKLKDIG